MIEMTKVSDEELRLRMISCTIDDFCRSGKLLINQAVLKLSSGSGQWPTLLVGQAPDFHVVTLKRFNVFKIEYSEYYIPLQY